MQYAKLRKNLITSFVIVITIGLISYAYYQSRSFIIGPKISITTPENGSTFHKPLISIEGRVERISYISMDDRQIFVDENGVFNEKLLLLPGYNIITLEVRDKFKRSIKKTIELMLLEEQQIKDVPEQVENNKDEIIDNNQNNGS
jgi:hypothetical protein